MGVNGRNASTVIVKDARSGVTVRARALRDRLMGGA
jgi:hypothetical protein